MGKGLQVLMNLLFGAMYPILMLSNAEDAYRELINRGYKSVKLVKVVATEETVLAGCDRR